jgi:hypothetical protein
MVKAFILFVKLFPVLLLLINSYILYKLYKKKWKNLRIGYMCYIVLNGILFLIVPKITIKFQYYLNDFINRKNIEKIIYEEKQIIIPMDVIFSQFNENHKRADELYKNKIIQVTGVVEDMYIIPERDYLNMNSSFIAFSDMNENVIFLYFLRSKSLVELNRDVIFKRNMTIIGNYKRYNASEKKVHIYMENCEILNIE